jgi:hypothetical protein
MNESDPNTAVDPEYEKKLSKLIAVTKYIMKTRKIIASIPVQKESVSSSASSKK